MLRLAIMVTCGWLMLAVPGKAAMISASGGQSGMDTELDACVPMIITELDFGNQPMLSHIETIGFRMTMWDGDTARGNFDRDNLSLWLDKVDTGLLLNGFPDQRLLTVTNWSRPRHDVQLALLAVLADGLVRADFMCGHRSHNSYVIPREYQATLFLSDQPLPEPRSVWLCVAGVLSLAGTRWFSRR